MPLSKQHNKVVSERVSPQQNHSSEQDIPVVRGTGLIFTIWKILIIIITTQNGGILPFVCSADTFELGVTNVKSVERQGKPAKCFIQESWSADYTACLPSCNFSNV